MLFEAARQAVVVSTNEITARRRLLFRWQRTRFKRRQGKSPAGLLIL